MSAIPTKYAGVQFRSRLEAKWAAMFDLLGWQWEYEPIDLDGYIPDFIVQINRAVLFEVKPIVEWPCPVPGCAECNTADRTEHDDAFAKISASGWKRDAVLVGATINGRFGHMQWADDIISKAHLEFCGRCRSISIQPGEDNFFGCGNCEKPACEPIRPDAWWREAGNRTQWRAPR